MSGYSERVGANLPEHLNDDRELLRVEGLNVLEEFPLCRGEGWTRCHSEEISDTASLQRLRITKRAFPHLR